VVKSEVRAQEHPRLRENRKVLSPSPFPFRMMPSAAWPSKAKTLAQYSCILQSHRHAALHVQQGRARFRLVRKRVRGASFNADAAVLLRDLPSALASTAGRNRAIQALHVRSDRDVLYKLQRCSASRHHAAQDGRLAGALASALLISARLDRRAG